MFGHQQISPFLKEYIHNEYSTTLKLDHFSKEEIEKAEMLEKEIYHLKSDNIHL